MENVKWRMRNGEVSVQFSALSFQEAVGDVDDLLDP
jgi:hypothetical protein